MEPTYVTLIARINIPIVGPDNAESRALSTARQNYPGLPWSVEHVEIPWGT